MYMTKQQRRVRCALVGLVLSTGFIACSDNEHDISQSPAMEAQPTLEAPPQYASSCGACHMAGAAGAPKTGDAGAWAARLKVKGMEGLVASVRNGLNAMPPGGLCNSCSDEDHVALISSTRMVLPPVTVTSSFQSSV